VWVPSILVFKGKKLRHVPGYPIYHPRLLRRKSDLFIVSYSGHGETITENISSIFAKIPYSHEFYDGDISGWMQKHIKLAQQEVESEARKGEFISARARLNLALRGSFFRVPSRFLYHFILRGGFMDGSAGFKYSLMYTWYEMTKYTVARELKNGKLE